MRKETPPIKSAAEIELENKRAGNAAQEAEQAKILQEHAEHFITLENRGATPEQLAEAKEALKGIETPEGQVELARARYIPEYLRTKKELSKLHRIRIALGLGNEGAYKKLSITDNSVEKYNRLKQEYDDARRDLTNSMMGEKIDMLRNAGCDGEDLEKAIAEYRSTEVLDKTIIQERQKLIDAKAEGQPVNPALWKKSLDWYRKQNWFVKGVVGTAAFVPVGILGGFLGGAGVAGLAGHTALRLTRSIVGGRLAAGANKGIDLLAAGKDKKFNEEQNNLREKFRLQFGSGEINQEQYEYKISAVEEKEKKRARSRQLAKMATGILAGGATSMAIAHFDIGAHLTGGHTIDNNHGVKPRTHTNTLAEELAEEKAKAAQAVAAEKARALERAEIEQRRLAEEAQAVAAAKAKAAQEVADAKSRVVEETTKTDAGVSESLKGHQEAPTESVPSTKIIPKTFDEEGFKKVVAQIKEEHAAKIKIETPEPIEEQAGIQDFDTNVPQVPVAPHIETVVTNGVQPEHIVGGVEMEHAAHLPGIHPEIHHDVMADPRHVENIDHVKDHFKFNKSDLIKEKPDTDSIHGMSYHEWNNNMDEFWKGNNVKFNSYEEYAQKSEMQRIFGGAMKITEGPNAGQIRIGVYDSNPTWPEVSHMDAKYFINFNKKDLASLAVKEPAVMNKMLQFGLVKDVGTGGKHVFEYTYESKELERLTHIFKKIDPEHYKPYTQPPESLEVYIGRMTAKVHEAQDGTMWAFKDGKMVQQIADQSRSTIGIGGRPPVPMYPSGQGIPYPPQGGIVNGVPEYVPVRMVDNGFTHGPDYDAIAWNSRVANEIENNYPRWYGQYNPEGFASPNYNIANRLGRIFGGYGGRWTH